MAHLHCAGIVARIDVVGIIYSHGHIVELARLGKIGFCLESEVESLVGKQLINDMLGGNGFTIHDERGIKFIGWC